MATMLLMRDLDARYKVTFRGTPETYEALSRLVSRLRASRTISFRGKRVTQEGLINAAILMLDAMPPDRFKAELVPQLGRLEILLTDEPAPARPAPGAFAGDPDGDPPRRRRKTS